MKPRSFASPGWRGVCTDAVSPSRRDQRRRTPAGRRILLRPRTHETLKPSNDAITTVAFPPAGDIGLPQAGRATDHGEDDRVLKSRRLANGSTSSPAKAIEANGYVEE